MSAPTADISTLSFEHALKELEGIVRRLEGGNADLESSMQDYARGTTLAQHCQKKLADAKLKVESIMRDADGTLSLKPLDAEA